jgi:hypothetical protein
MNITGTFATDYNLGNQYSGAFFKSSKTSSNEGGAGDHTCIVNEFDASRSWTGATSSNGAHSHTITDSAGVLGKSNTVQPPATQMYLYFFIGNYARPQSDIDIGELVELINERDFEGQVADGKQELTTTKNNGITEINTTKNNCIKEINSTSVSNRVLKTGDTMTGNLVISKSGTSDLVLTNTDIDYTSTTAPSSAVRVGGVFARDKNNKVTGCVQSYVDTNGNYITNMYARRSVEGAEKSCSISTYVGPTGNVWTYAPTPATGDNSTKIATTAFCKNMATTTKATTTSSASATRPAWIVQNYVNGKSWYRVWSDGWIEQGGASIATSDQNYQTVTVSLLKTFSNTNYHVSVTASWTDDTGSGTGYFAAQTTSSFKASFCGYGYSWYACGY